MSYGSRGTADGLKSLDVNWLHRNGYLTPGRSSSVRWTRRDEYAGSIGLRAELGRVVLSYRSNSYGQAWEDVEEHVALSWSPCNFGGERPWFVCPGARCGRRVGKLYAAGKYFLCRHCYDLAYDCQREVPRDRLLRKAQNIRTRLGGSASMAEPFPYRPKGMHRKTYERLRGKAEETEWRMLGALRNYLDRLHRR